MSGIPSSSRKRSWVGPALIAAAVVLAYANSFSGVFVFDDPESIVRNPTIRRLWPLSTVLSPPYAQGETVGGRPVLNLSFALNHAVSGMNIWSYHALNLAIHLAAALALYGILRRTLRREGAALAAALLWAVHPLQTESVAYISQRAESMMGMFYLVTLYCFIRYVEAASSPLLGVEEAAGTPLPRLGGSVLWGGLGFIACLLGMGTKEVMVSAPLVILLYDRTFLSGSFREAWRRHGRLHAALASTWILLAWLVLSAHGRGGSSGLNVGVSWWGYVLTQFPAVLHYLRLTVWPHPLIFDYGAVWVGSAWNVLPSVIAVGFLLLGSLVLLFRAGAEERAFGFAGIFFFAILAPSSLVPGIRETMAEHRMYLASAPVLAVAVAVLAARVRWMTLPRGVVVVATIAAIFIGLTWRRNRVYRSELALWQETAKDRPGNPYAHNNLGHALEEQGRPAEAKAEFAEALRLKPDYPEANNNFGNALRAEGRPARALPYFQAALRERPNYPAAWNDLGVVWIDLGRGEDAVKAFSAALMLQPDYPEAHYNLANVLAANGRPAEAIEHYEAAIRLDPAMPQARMNLGTALARNGQVERAISVYREASRRFPANAEIHFNLGNALVLAGRTADGAAEYEAALRIDPHHEKARSNLERIRGLIGRSP